jgi:ADP-heptose:LPS heptosyltransferase
MKILLISLAGIGDTLLATPLVRELRANFPDARIETLVLWAGSRDLFEGNPHLDAVHWCNFLKQSGTESLRFLLKLRNARFDVSINTHPQSRIHYRAVARIIAAPVRISHRYDCWRWFDRCLVNRILEQDYTRHTVEQNLDALALVGGKVRFSEHRTEVFLSGAELEWAEAFVTERALSNRKLLGVHVGSGGTKNLKLKRWPLECYLELFRRLKYSRPALVPVFFGGPDEFDDINKIIEETGGDYAFHANTRNLRQAAALMKHCHAFLSVDTALMHLAAAMQVANQFVIEAPTLNATNLPYANPFTLIENPAVHGRNLEFYRYDGRGIKGSKEELIRCMKAVSVEKVEEALSRVF